VEKRTPETFYGLQPDPIVAQLKPVRQTATPALPSRINFVSPHDLDKFRWDDILNDKVPRDYQFRSFIDALLADVILVMPTGSGKTLISSMVLSRMCKENTNQIGLFIVHRIPLVFQQAAAIRSDTGLKVIGLCSENTTKLKINQVCWSHKKLKMMVTF
jgi:superfamily II DNA or RNA helicase